jgi:hypothetical protein
MVLGQCNRGEVAFKIDDDISEVFICHCSICRKSTGSNGIAVVVVDNEAFKWMRGENQVLTWKKTIGNWETSFCRVCGSTLPGINDESRMYVPAGLITNGDESLKVVHHIWVDSKAVWDEIGDSGKQHRQAYKDK